MSKETFLAAVVRVLNEAKSPEVAAKAINTLCWHEAIECGMKPEIEVGLWEPGKKRFNGRDNVWSVAWESCPYYEWAIIASGEVSNANFIAEPYYSFDLNFYPKKEAAK
jgi:hypothetical protein